MESNMNRRNFIKTIGISAAATSISGIVSLPTTPVKRASAAISSVSRKASGGKIYKTYILNVDSMSADCLGKKGLDGKPLTPNLDWLVQKGTHFTRCYVPLPALTDCNHTAIVSSASPGRSGILGFGAYFSGIDSKTGTARYGIYDRRHIQCETLYDTIKQYNPKLKTAIITGKNWVGDLFQGQGKDSPVDIKVHGRAQPSYIPKPTGYIFGGGVKKAEPLPRLYIRGGEGEKVPEGCFTASGLFGSPTTVPSDHWVIESAIKVIEQEDPDFIYILLAATDDSGHIYGAFVDDTAISTIDNPTAKMDEMHLTDQAVGHFFDYLKRAGRFDDTLIIFTADHGMSTIRVADKIDPKDFQEQFLLWKVKSEINIRQILKQAGFAMRANDGSQPYNPSGDYDTAFSEGPDIYIYYIKKDRQKGLIEALWEWNDQNPDHPILAILDKEEMEGGFNQRIGMPYNLLNHRSFTDPDWEVRWPDVVVFLDKGYFCPMYGDLVSSGFPIIAGMKPTQNITMPGLHGSFSEQHVPLALHGPGIPNGKVVDIPVSVLDIVPTIASINPWPIPKGAEGRSLL